MGQIVHTECKWSVLTLNLQYDSRFWTLENAETICPEAQQGFGQGKPLHFGSTFQGKAQHFSMIAWVRLSEPDPSTTFSGEIR